MLLVNPRTDLEFAELAREEMAAHSEVDPAVLEKIEGEKAELDPADPQARSLSAHAEDLAEELHRKTLVQRDLADTAADSA